MKTIKRSAAALLLAVLLVLSVLPASAQSTLTYSTQSNSGTRDEVCITLEGTSADRYYTGNYTYEALSVLSEEALYAALAELMTSTHKRESTYSNCRDMAVKTDCENNDGRVTLIYTSFSATRAQFGGSGAAWNREHIWPKSLGGFDTLGPGADLHHIRPSDVKVNADRGNYKYGNVSNGGNVTASAMVGTTFVGGTRSGGYFEPLDNAKGDIARICLYVYVRYGNDASYRCGNIATVFESVDVLLEWCALDPVDTWEMGRNEVVGAYQGNRNVFIDYPELAWLMFGREVPENMTTPSGETKDTPTPPVECQHTNKETRNAVDPGCNADGYTGDIYCKDCGEKLSVGVAVAKTGEHTNTEIRNRKEPLCDEMGYSGDTYCTDCGTRLVMGTPLPALGAHQFKDGDIIVEPTETTEGLKEEICTVCGFSQATTMPPSGNDRPNDPENTDNSYLMIAVTATAAVCLIAVTAVVLKKKKKQ